MHKFILLGLLPAMVMARPGSSPFFLRRTEYEGKTSCEELGMQDCGGCIPLDHTCCPQEVGGCPADMRCVVGDDGQDGCCPDDFVCTGDGGVNSTTFSPAPTTSASPDVPEPTTTAEVDSSSPAEELPTPTATEDASPSPTTTDEAQSTEDADADQSSTSEAAATTSEPASDSTSEPTDSTDTASEDSTATSTLASFATTTTDSTSYSTSTVYTTSTKTLTSCAASSPCQSGTGASSIILVTETVAVSTTLCPITTTSVSEPTIKDGDDDDDKPHPTGTTSLLPIIKPSVVCPGHNDVCHPIISTGVPSYSGELDIPTTTGIAPSGSSFSGEIPAPTTTTTTTGIAPSGYLPSSATTSTQAVVTAGASRAGIMGVGMGAAVVGFGVVQGVF